MHENSALDFLSNNYLLLLIFFLGLGLRTIGLGRESLWYDEAVSVTASKLGILDQIKWNISQSDNNPPLYYALLHFWVLVFGDSEFSVRFPSTVFGSLSIIAIYGLGNLLFDRKTGLLAALILSTSVFHVWFSQEARAYTLLTLLTLLSFYCFVKILSSPGDRLYKAAYLMTGVLLLYTHYYGLPVIAAQNIYCFTQYFRRRTPGRLGLSEWLKLQLLLLFLFLPAFMLMLKQGSVIRQGFWITKPPLLEVLGYFLTYSGSTPILLILLIFSLLALAGVAGVKNEGKFKGVFQPLDACSGAPCISYGSRIYLLFLWIFCLILVPFLISCISTPILVYRYTIGASPVLYLLASRGITGTNNNRLILVLAALITIFSLINVEEKYRVTDKFQWRESVAAIEAEAGHGDIMAVYPQFELEPVRYYSKRKDILKGPLGFEFFSTSDARDKNIWVIISTHWGIDKEAMKKELEKRYDLVSEKKFAFVDVYKLKIKTEDNTTAIKQ